MFLFTKNVFLCSSEKRYPSLEKGVSDPQINLRLAVCFCANIQTEIHENKFSEIFGVLSQIYYFLITTNRELPIS